MKPLRVLHVIPSVSRKHGGPSIAVKNFARAAGLCDVRVTIATTDDDGPDARLHVPLNETVSVPGEADYIYFSRTTRAYKTSTGLAKWLRKNGLEFDVLHIHALFSFASTAAAWVARKHKVPYFVRPLGVLNRWGLMNRRRSLKKFSLQQVELPILRSASAIHYTSEAERREASQVRPDIGKLPSIIVPIPVEIEMEQSKGADRFCARFSEAAGRRIILFLSRLDPKKGIELLLSAFDEVYRDFPDALLVIAGAGEDDYVRTLRQRGRSLPSGGAILWMGFVAGAEKEAVLAAASIFVLPSFSENFGIAAAEALAAGIPSILSTEVAIASDAAEAGAALVVSCETASIADAMRRLLSDAELRDRLHGNAVSFVQQRYSFEAVGKQLRSAYDRALAEPAKSESKWTR